MNYSAAQNNPENSVGGFPCPRCKAQIRFPIQALLVCPSITCSQCGLELFIDMERSDAALEDLRRYVDGMDDAERVLEENR